MKARAEAVGTYRHVNVFLMETLASWVPTTPEMEAKVLFGRHLWLVAQMADRLGRRARELRAPLHFSRDPAPSYATALRAAAALASSPARLEAFYGAILDSLDKAYGDYLARTDALIDEPTVVIVQDAVRDIARMRSDAARLLEEFPALRQPGSAGAAARLFTEASPMIAPSAAAQPQPA